MVQVLGVTFAILLVCAHLADLQGDAYHRPLSMFRDYEPAWIGFALFGVLVAIGFETARTAYRVGARPYAALYFVSTCLICVVAATPSFDEIHALGALTVMMTMFLFYAVLLFRNDCFFWLIMHLLTPSVLMMGSRLESYGIWQKGMILYFLVAVVVHQGLLAAGLEKRPRRRSVRTRIQVRRR